MESAFVIMALDRPEVERMYENVIAPALQLHGLTPVRVDKTDGRETISARILDQMNAATVIIADLTFERPNCYYEAGYGAALGKPVLLTARDDHNPRRPERGVEDPKVHFDLDGHRITYWSGDRLDSAKEELVGRVGAALSAQRVTPVPSSDVAVRADLDFASQRAPLEQDGFLAELRMRGHWDVLIHPLGFNEKRLQNISDLPRFVESSRVELPNWPAPHSGNVNAYEIHQNFVSQVVNMGIVRESWQLFQSGQFVYRFGMPEDWMDHRSGGAPGNWEKGAELYEEHSALRYAAIFELAARLSRSAGLGFPLRVVVKVVGLKGRVLGGSVDRPLLKEVSRPGSANEYEFDEVMQGPDDRFRLGLEGAQELFKRFAWNPPLGLLQQLQKGVRR